MPTKREPMTTALYPPPQVDGGLERTAAILSGLLERTSDVETQVSLQMELAQVYQTHYNDVDLALSLWGVGLRAEPGRTRHPRCFGGNLHWAATMGPTLQAP